MNSGSSSNYGFNCVIVNSPETAISATTHYWPTLTERHQTTGVWVWVESGKGSCQGALSRFTPLLTSSRAVTFGESSSKVLILSRLMKLKAFTYLMKKQKE